MELLDRDIRCNRGCRGLRESGWLVLSLLGPGGLPGVIILIEVGPERIKAVTESEFCIKFHFEEQRQISEFKHFRCVIITVGEKDCSFVLHRWWSPVRVREQHAFHQAK